MGARNVKGLKKNLPKRAVSEGLKTRRARSWDRGRKRKAARQEVQREAHKRNLDLIARGLPTPKQASSKSWMARHPVGE